MLDEATDTELKVLSVSFSDPYLLILRDDSSVTILEANSAGELEEIEPGEGILANHWLSGCVYQPPSNDAKPAAFLLSPEGFLKVGFPCENVVYAAADGLALGIRVAKLGKSRLQHRSTSVPPRHHYQRVSLTTICSKRNSC